MPKPKVTGRSSPAHTLRTSRDRLVAQVRAAWQRREAVHNAGTTSAFRLINGAGDGIPGITVDYFDGVLVVNRYDDDLEEAVLIDALAQSVPGATSVYVKRRPRSLSRLSADQTAVLAPATPLWGVARPDVVVRENGLRFQIQPGDGLSTGLFVDMRDTRALVQSRSHGRTVLNLFAYTCAFGVAAMSGGATRVLNIDASRRVLEWGKRNYALNGLAVDDYDFVYGEAFDWLRRLARRRTLFDLVVCDPPSFSTVKGRPFSATQHYGALVGASLPVTAPGGLLLCCANEVNLPRVSFQAACLQAIRDAGRAARIVYSGGASRIDHPQAAGHDDPLKVILIEV